MKTKIIAILIIISLVLLIGCTQTEDLNSNNDGLDAATLNDAESTANDIDAEINEIEDLINSTEIDIDSSGIDEELI